MKNAGVLFADKTHKIFSKIEFVNALTQKEMSHLNKKYLYLGLNIKQVVVDNYGNEKNKKKSSFSDLLSKKRYRNHFNSLKDFLYKYYGKEDSLSVKKIKKNKSRKLSGNDSTKKISQEELFELKNGLYSIKEDCKRIDYKICLTEDNDLKSKIIHYILQFRKYISNEQYSFLFDKWKNELSKIKGVNLFNSDENNNLFNWKISILKSFKSEIILYSMCNICDHLLNGEKVFVEDKNMISVDKMKNEEKKMESTVSDINESSDAESEDDENIFNRNQALLLQFVKNARNDEENF
jgi:hypothetical protein